MDLQKFVDNAVTAAREERMKTSDQLTLGELIALIEPISVANKNKGEEEAEVVYDFAYFFPTDIMSWRGSYAEIALNYQSEEKRMKVTAFLAMLRGALGKTFTGYKGGDYVMWRGTPVWVSNYSEACNTAVVGVKDLGWQVVIETKYSEY